MITPYRTDRLAMLPLQIEYAGEMAEVLSDCGARVVLADIEEERLHASVERLGEPARGVVADVRDEASVQALFDDVVAAEGGVDVGFANAGLASVPGFRVDGEESKDLALSDVRGVFFTTPHWNGYPAVLIRIRDLARLDRDDLRDAVVDAWLTRAPKRVARAWLAEND